MLLRTLCAKSPKLIANFGIIKVEDIPRLKEFLRKTFYRDEPLVSTLKILEHENSLKTADTHITSQIKCDNSVMATTDSGELMGVCINKFKVRAEGEEYFEDHLMSKIFALFAKAEKEMRFFEKFRYANKYMLLENLAVDEKFRNQKLAERLILASMDVAYRFGCTVVRIDCTNIYAAKLARKLGFSKLYELKYDDYRDCDNNVIFEVEPPHTEFAVYAKKIRC